MILQVPDCARTNVLMQRVVHHLVVRAIAFARFELNILTVVSYDGFDVS
ncbi:hypothetical protein HMPREF9244_00962 [Alloscardovia omnicolens F0580]|uniref:Uncharacterized protein n=1 Tax=Alloscardovia omnicolens F0580 TaxID=1321816 RepID=U1SIJ9_9BIFI|nr:hypothetical protein HMPREF9244_00962 [Alloscardovia omnicolens F0580]